MNSQTACMTLDATLNPRTGSKARVAIVAPQTVASFIQQDAILLSRDFDTVIVPVRRVFSLRCLYTEVRRANAIVIWFLGRHAIPATIIAKLFRKPLVSVIGGFEVAWEEDIGYGIKPNSLRESVLKILLRNSSVIVVVSDFSRRLTIQRFPELADRIELIHNAVDTQLFDFVPGRSRSGVLCVATLTATSIKVKNLDLLARTAAAMPDVQFTLVGPALDKAGARFASALPSNMKWVDQLLGDQLVDVYREASVYAQLSRHESFSLALAEAMACGCIPVITNGGALPEVGGEVARVIPDMNPDSVARVIRDCLQANVTDRMRARERIVTNFGIEKRRAKLASLLQNLHTPRT